MEIILEEVLTPHSVKKHYYHNSQHKEILDAEQQSAWLTNLLASLSGSSLSQSKAHLERIRFSLLFSGYPLFILMQ